MNKSSPNFFSLTSAEKIVFKALHSDTPIVPSELTRKTSIPRTTLLRTLASLKSRGFIESHKIGKRVAWKRVPQGILEKNLLESASDVGISITGLVLPEFRL